MSVQALDYLGRLFKTLQVTYGAYRNSALHSAISDIFDFIDDALPADWPDWDDLVTSTASGLGIPTNLPSYFDNDGPTALFGGTLMQAFLNNTLDFSITTGTPGAVWEFGENLTNMIEHLYDSIQEYFSEGGSLGNDVIFNLPSGKTLKLTNNIGELLDFKVDFTVSIQKIEMFGVEITLPDCKWTTFVDLIFKALSVKWEWLPDLNSLDYQMPNSNLWVFARGIYKDNPQIGTVYDPDEYYYLFRDGFGKDGSVIAAAIAFAWAVKELGSYEISQKFTKKVFNVKNLNVYNTVTKSLINTNAIITDMGDPDETDENKSTVFSKFLKNYKNGTAGIAKTDDAIEAVEAIDAKIGDDPIESDDLDAVKAEIISNVNAYLLEQLEKLPSYRPFG